MPSSRARSRATLSIGSTKSEQMSVPPGAISSAAIRPVSAGPAANSSTRWPGWGSIASIIHARDGHRAALHGLAARGPAGGRALPLVAAAGAVPVGVRTGISSAGRSAGEQLARRRAREARRRTRSPSGTLKPARRVRQCSRSSRSDASAPGLITTAATTALPHSGIGAPVKTPASATAGWAASTASTSAGATFSPPVTIVSALRPGHGQAAVGVELAQVAGVQPAVGASAPGRHGRPGDEDLAVGRDLDRGARKRLARRLAARRSPTSSPASRPRSGRRSAREGRRPRPRPRTARAAAARRPSARSAARRGVRGRRRAAARASWVRARRG